MKATITQEFLRRLPTGPVDVWDVRMPGLLLRVRASGAASWAVQYGRGRRMTIGRVDVLTPAKARARAQQVLGEAAHDRDPMAERRKKRAATLRDFLLHEYEPWATAHRKTGDETAHRVRVVFPAFLTKPMGEITAFAVERWRTQRRRDGITDNTLNRDLAALRAVLTKAIQWKVLATHPLAGVKPARIDVLARIRYLSPDEERRLRAALEQRDEDRREGRRRFNAWRQARGYKTLPEYGTYPDHLHPLVLVALNTGLRRGELLALTWADVDLVGARLTVRGVTAKAGRTRHLPLNIEAVRVLKAWGVGEPEAFVFPGPRGEQMTTLKTAWLKVAAAAGLKNFRFHDLRHSFASKLVQHAIDLNTVRELLGHANITMTLRYAHLDPRDTAAAVAKLVSG